MSTTQYGFDLSHRFSVAFTSGVFAPDNSSFADAIVRGDRSRSHRLLVIVDSGVASTHPNLNEDIATYCDHHAPMLALASPLGVRWNADFHRRNAGSGAGASARRPVVFAVVCGDTRICDTRFPGRLAANTDDKCHSHRGESRRSKFSLAWFRC